MPTATTTKLQAHETEREIANENVIPDDLSDAGNTQMFVLNYGNDLRFVDGLGWLHWTGNVWKPDKHAPYQAAERFTQTLRQNALSLYSDALHKAADAEVKYRDSGDESDKKELEQAKAEAEIFGACLAHAKRSRNKNRISAIVELSSHDKQIARDISDFDSKWSKLNTPDGVIDLQTGETTFNTEAHDSRYQYFTQITDTKSSSAGHELWEEFISTITCGDTELACYLQEVSGLSLYGRVFKEGTFFCIGSGRNGKSTFWNAIQKVLGTYAGSIDVDTLTTAGQNKGSEMASLRGKRLVVAKEMEENRQLSASMLKQITSRDQIHANPKYYAPYDFWPTHTLVMFTNHLPKVKSRDDGTWERIRIIPFNANFKGREIPDYEDYLIEHSGGAILRWCVEGAVRFWKNDCKLIEPEAVKRATGEYKERQDWLTRFINKHCTTETDAQERLTDLYDVYRDWAEYEGEDRLKKREFDAKLVDAGFKRTEHSRVVTFHGIGLAY